MDIKNFTRGELEKMMEALKEPRYRAKQVFHWLYKKNARGFGEMADLPERLREGMAGAYSIDPLETAEHLVSKDRSEKFLMKLKDGNLIATVFIPAGRRGTLCLSTQVGCKYGCLFCASGRGGFKRDLAVSEILGQILARGKKQKKITNYVFMGMGEPLDNYDNTTKAILIMNDREGMNIGARRITISTCGLAPGIERLKDFGLQINLSVSLHAANDALRERLLPVNKVYPLARLTAACKDYVINTKRAITLEYILIKGINDSLKDADGLSAIAKDLRARINLIPCSPVPGSGYRPPDDAAVRDFMERLAANKRSATLRQSKGKDINAACGQLGEYAV